MSHTNEKPRSATNIRAGQSPKMRRRRRQNRPAAIRRRKQRAENIQKRTATK